ACPWNRHRSLSLRARRRESKIEPFREFDLILSESLEEKSGAYFDEHDHFRTTSRLGQSKTSSLSQNPHHFRRPCYSKRSLSIFDNELGMDVSRREPGRRLARFHFHLYSAKSKS